MARFNYPLGSGGKPQPKAAPVAEPENEQEFEQEAEPQTRPVMTHHHEDGSHTTIHEGGEEVHHANHKALHEHLKKHMPEAEGAEPEPDSDDEGY